jgi:hypothetical protein
MSLLDDILKKVGLQKAPPKPAAATGPANLAPMKPQGTFGQPTPMTMVDVVSKLDKMAAQKPIKLDWRQSINDLLVVLDLPHSAKDMDELAKELNCPIDDPTSFKRNMWLHKTVLQKLSDNGGNIPPDLLKK